MIRKLVFVGLIVGLSACSSVPSGQTAATTEAGVQAPTDSSADLVCDSSPIMSLVGETFTPELGDSARKQSHSETTRVLHPGEVMTMDYNQSRLNLILDEQNKIITIHCG